MEWLIILFLIIVNGLFSMAEIAIVSSKRAKLQKLFNEGNISAKKVIDLKKNPNKFLSTVQIGTSIISIFLGTFVGITIGERIASFLNEVGFISPYGTIIGAGIVVITISLLSIVLGELVPKRIGLSNPEWVASSLVGIMNFFSDLLSPVVYFLGISTEAVLSIFQIPVGTEGITTQEEIKIMVKEGTKIGIFDIEEKDIFERTLKLGDKKAQDLMLSKSEIIWLDINSSSRDLIKKISSHQRSYYPVVDKTIDKLEGIVRAEDLSNCYLRSGKVDLVKLIHKPLLITANDPAFKILELFKKTGIHLALVINEFGEVVGMVALTDILEDIVGNIPDLNEIDSQNS